MDDTRRNTDWRSDRLPHHRTLKEVAAIHIRDLIFSGAIAAGSRIDQDAIAAQLGISRLPVREALITLAEAALVDLEPRRGAFVAHISRDDLRDHYRIYAAVAQMAAEAGAAKITNVDIDALRSNITAMAQSKSGTEREELNRSFHRSINRLGASRRLRVMLRGMEAMVFGDFHAADAEWNDNAVTDHEYICTALEQGDGVAAGREVRRHIEEGGDHVMGILEKRGFWKEQ